MKVPKKFTKMIRKAVFDNLNRSYDNEFSPSREYLDSLPDLQNSEYQDQPIDFVGIHNFKLPLKIQMKNNTETQEVLASITGSVSLEAEKRGINMSRIIRTFYKFKDEIFTINQLEDILRGYKNDLESFDAHIIINFQYREWLEALRTENGGGWQYYNITFDCNLDKDGEFKKVMWVDFVYSSACPCSTALSQHAAQERNVFGIPHSQRSIARIGIESRDVIWIEDILDACRRGLTTETLVFCKRADEQAFAEKNGAQPKFVEDSIRIISHELNKMERILDYKIICSHQESLHSHDAIAVTTKGIKNSIFNHHVSLGEFQSMKV